jgi:hypothetical protein
MSDLNQYIARRKKRDKEFAEGYEEGYEQFKIGVMLPQARGGVITDKGTDGTTMDFVKKQSCRRNSSPGREEYGSGWQLKLKGGATSRSSGRPVCRPLRTGAFRCRGCSGMLYHPAQGGR